MIGRLKGILLEKQAPELLLEVNGVAYEIYAPMSTFYQLADIGKEIILYTHLVVREDAQTLYGFAAKRERELFRTLIKISGVGPRLALAILSGMEPERFVQCVNDNDVASLVHIPGIGKKTAERLLVELRDKVTATLPVSSCLNDAVTALIALGYRPQDAQKAISPHKEKQLPSEELIRLALRDLAKS